jgi:Arc/MetJ family transcription regulator
VDQDTALQLAGVLEDAIPMAELLDNGSPVVVCLAVARYTSPYIRSEVPMAKMMIDIDEDLLAYASEVLGTSTKKATVHAALRAATAKQARAREFAAIASGELDLSRVREEAWR